MLTHQLKFLISEKINFLILDMKDYYISMYGDYENWDAVLYSIFSLNCDVNIDSILEDYDIDIHPLSSKYGICLGILELHNDDNSYYNIKNFESTNIFSYDDSVKLYDEMINNISSFIFEGK
jgi:hypothetical protein